MQLYRRMLTNEHKLLKNSVEIACREVKYGDGEFDGRSDYANTIMVEPLFGDEFTC